MCTTKLPSPFRTFTYHIQIERHHYSVPYQYLGRHVRARVGAQIVEIFHGETRIAAHLRGRVPEKYTTKHAHMPKSTRRLERGRRHDL